MEEKTIGELLGLTEERDEEIFNLAIEFVQNVDDLSALLSITHDKNLSEKEKIVLAYYIGLISGAGGEIAYEEEIEDIKEIKKEDTKIMELLSAINAPQTYNN